MSKEFNPQIESNEPGTCQIRVKGHLGSDWVDWFDGLMIARQENGDTLLTGPVVDQAALFGLLRKVRDLGMPLVSVVCTEPGPLDQSALKDIGRSHEQNQ